MGLHRNAKGRKPQYFKDPATDALLDMVVKLTAELSVTRDRLDAFERLVERQNIGFSQEDLETYSETPAEAETRHAKRRDLVAKVLQVLQDEVAEATKPDAFSSLEDLAEELASIE